MNIKNILLIGTFLALMLIVISCVSAADTPNETQVANVEQNAYGDTLANVSQINHTLVYDNERIILNNTCDNIIIKNNHDKIDIHDVTSDVVIIKNSEPVYINLRYLTINTLVLDNVNLHSRLWISFIAHATINKIIVINSDIKYWLGCFSIQYSDIKHISLINSHVDGVWVRGSIIGKVSYTLGSTLFDITKKENATIGNVSEIDIIPDGDSPIVQKKNGNIVITNIPCNDYTVIHPSDSKVENRDVDMIFDNRKRVDLKNVKSKFVMIKNSRPDCINIQDSTIHCLVINNTKLSSLTHSSGISNSTIDCLIIVNSSYEDNEDNLYIRSIIENSTIKHVYVVDSYADGLEIKNSSIGRPIAVRSAIYPHDYTPINGAWF